MFFARDAGATFTAQTVPVWQASQLVTPLHRLQSLTLLVPHFWH